MKNLHIKGFIAPITIALALFIVCMFTDGGFFGDVWYGSGDSETEIGTEDTAESGGENNSTETESDKAPSESESNKAPEETEDDVKEQIKEEKEEVDQTAKVITALANCFTIPGLFMAGAAAIGWVASFGTFDMLVYGTGTFVGYFIKPVANKLPKTYYDYKAGKDEKGRRWSVESLIVGGAFFAVGMIFVIISLII